MRPEQGRGRIGGVLAGRLQGQIGGQRQPVPLGTDQPLPMVQLGLPQQQELLFKHGQAVQFAGLGGFLLL